MITKEEIKELRKSRDMTQESFAASLGVSWRTVAGWEAGRSHPSRMAMKMIQNLLRGEDANDNRNAS